MSTRLSTWHRTDARRSAPAAQWLRWLADRAAMVMLLAAAVVSGLLVHQEMTGIQFGLPLNLMEQRHDMQRVHDEIDSLAGLLDQGPARGESSRAFLDRVRVQLGRGTSAVTALHRTHAFDSIDGAAAVHAQAMPVIHDLGRWLYEGVGRFPPHGSVVLDLARERARTGRADVHAAIARADAEARRLLEAEAGSLRRLRHDLLIYLMAFAVLAAVAAAMHLRSRRAEREAARDRSRLVDAISGIDEGFVLVDAGGRIVVCNSSFLGMFPAAARLAQPGAEFETVQSRLLAPGHVTEVYDAAGYARGTPDFDPGTGANPIEVTLLDGRHVRVTRRRTQEGGTVCLHTDITDVRATCERLRRLASQDSLTGLNTRRQFEVRLSQALRLARRRAERTALMFLDLDRFKAINDNHGHAAGDRVLAAIGSRMLASLREEDVIGRLGGDEFAVLIGPAANRDEVEASARRLLESLEHPIETSTGTHRCSVSIGIAIFPEDGETPRALLEAADAACYESKAAGGNRYAFRSSADPTADTGT